MNALLKKEFRENLWLMVPGVLIFTALLGSEYVAFCGSMTELIRGRVQHLHIVHPLKGDVIEYSMFFCAIFGSVLGWLQVFRERQRNVWAFLFHRPVRPATIFLSKVVSGLFAYALICGLPLLVFVLWASQPGNVAAPFDWWLLAPLASSFLAGVLYFFAGLLSGARRARWYVSGFLGFGMPFLVSCVTLTAPHFWPVLALWLVALWILWVAARSSFCNSGYDLGQNAAGKVTTAAAVASGWTILLFLAAALVADIVGRWAPDRPWTYHVVSNDGSIFKIVSYGEGAPQIMDRQGREAQNLATGQPLTLAELHSGQAESIGMHETLHRTGEVHRRWLDYSWRSLGYWGTSKATLWYFKQPECRLIGYDVAFRKLVGSIGPSGFTKGLASGGDRFEILGPHTLGTSTAIYTADLAKPGLIPIFSTASEDPIIEAADVKPGGRNWQHTIVITRKSVLMLTPEGKTVWRTNYSPPYHSAGAMRIYALDAPNAFVLWNDAPIDPRKAARAVLPSKVAWIRDGQVVETAEIEPRRDNQGIGFQEYLAGGLVPPLAVALAPWYTWWDWPAEWWHLLLVSLIAAAICGPVTWAVARRREVSTPGCIAWSLGTFLFGIAGLLALISLEEAVARKDSEANENVVEIFEEQNAHAP